MELPKILVTGKFKPDDLEVSVSGSNRKVDPIVEGKLDAVWEAKVKKAEENGQICYNGVSYRLNSIEENKGKVIINFGTFEFKVRESLSAIPEYFNLPEIYYRKGCFSSASVKTSDNLYLMVELTGKSMNLNNIDLVGGIMEVGVEMNTGYDVFRSFYDELEEETGATVTDIKDIYLQSIYLGEKTNVGFYFEVILNVTSVELLERFKGNKDVDIKSIRAFTKEEYLDVLNTHRSMNKHLVAELLSI